MKNLVAQAMAAVLASMPNGPSHKEYPEQKEARLAARGKADERAAWNARVDAKKHKSKLSGMRVDPASKPR